MPGSIQISVLDIVNLPSTSPPSSMSIQVTMGKREYQIGDDGDFSIPLTTLRENLVVKLLDPDGNEMSRTGTVLRPNWLLRKAFGMISSLLKGVGKCI